ncbi:MAG: PfkB family carbohydrate kinase [Clostridiales bacterium]|jgi:ribokinase|nr:PfkB family carbohydrate kinase [Clostridiales bacterium]
MKILNFGSLCFNRIYAVESFARAGNLAKAKAFSVEPGGRGFCQSIAMARAGSLVYHAGKAGSDGQAIIDALNENGVNESFVLRSANSSGHSVIQVNKYGNACVLTNDGANNEITTVEIDQILDNFSAGDFLTLQNEISNVSYIIESASRRGMVVALNPSPVNEALYRVDLNHVNYLILNEDEGYALTGEAKHNRILDKLLDSHTRMKVVLTLGRNGSFYAETRFRLRQDAFVCLEEDSSCAGDAFFGYFISRISMGIKPWTSLRVASEAAAISVSKHGAYTSIPLKEEVEAFTKKP